MSSINTFKNQLKTRYADYISDGYSPGQSYEMTKNHYIEKLNT